MYKSPNSFRAVAGALALSLSTLTFIVGTTFVVSPGTSHAAGASDIENGKSVAFNRKKGNCLACHEIAGGTLPGNIGPALVGMKARYPKKADLRAQIWDATSVNPNTIMPPFGKHRILTEKEIDLVVEFIHSL